jgi:hypothetical protein
MYYSILSILLWLEQDIIYYVCMGNKLELEISMESHSGYRVVLRTTNWSSLY